jgi:hypothetical protein
VVQDLDPEDLAERPAPPDNDQLLEQRDNDNRGRGRGQRGRGRGQRAARPAPYQRPGVRPENEKIDEEFPEVNFHARRGVAANEDDDVQILEEIPQQQAPQVKKIIITYLITFLITNLN